MSEFITPDGGISISSDERDIVLNRIRTPDGTILISHHRHDYVTYIDKNGFEYMVDGGNEYLRRTVHDEDPYEELSLYSDAPFEELRLAVCRGGRGKNGDQPLKWVPIAEMNDEWVAACIPYNEKRGFKDSFHTNLYRRELEYRKENNISIKPETNE